MGLCVLPLAAPQGPAFETLDNGLRLRQARVEGCIRQALVLLWPVGSEDDPPEASGLAQAVAERMTVQARGGMQLQARVHGRFTALYLTVDVSRAAEAAGLLASLLVAGDGTDPDAAARAIARAALRADDLAVILPGPVLRARARAALFSGTPGARPVGGDPLQTLALEAEALSARRRACYGPEGAVLAGAGGLDEEGWAAVRAAFAAVPSRDSELPAASAPPAPETPVEAVTEHRLVDAPYVAAATRAPDPADPRAPEFAVAMEVLRSQALLVFRKYRGNEHVALFPFVAYDFAAGDRLAMIGRRGNSWKAPEGDRDVPQWDPLEKVRGEIEALLVTVRDKRLTAAEVARAGRVLALQLALPPYDRATARSLAEEPSGLMARALALALYARWQWPEDLPARLQAARPEAVQAVLDRALDAEAVWWSGLVPVPPTSGR